MQPHPFRLLVALVASLCAPLLAQAHLPGESALVLSADEENLEVMVSLSLPSAAALLSAKAAPLSAASLEQHRPVLLAAAPRVCTLLDGKGEKLSPDRVLVSLHDGHELRFHFLFAAVTRPARLRMSLLPDLPQGAFCKVSDLRRPDLADCVLTAAAPEAPLAAASR